MYLINNMVCIQSNLDRSVFQLGEEVIASTNELIVDDDHRDSFPIIFLAVFFSLFSSFRGLSINVLKCGVIFSKVCSYFSAEWTVVVSQNNNLCHLFPL